MGPLLLSSLLGCPSDAPRPPSPDGHLPAMSIRPGPSSDVIQLHLRVGDGRLDLADHNLPPSPAAAEHTIPLEPTGKRQVVPLPFRLDPDRIARIGLDLTVEVDGRPLRHAPLGGGPNSWRLVRDGLLIHPRPGATSATLRYAATDALLDRLSLERSGLPPERFVQHRLTLEGTTVPGLLLPSPSSIAWTVTVPPRRPRLRTTLSLLPPPVDGRRSDGLSFRVEVETDAGTEVLAEERLDAVGFRDVEVDLARWAGQTVSIGFRTAVEGSPDYDYAFVGAPTIWGRPEDEGAIRRVVVLGLDTTRVKSIGWYGYPTPTTPELDALADRSVVAVNAWTPAPRTRPSFRSATTGRYPLLAVGATNIGEVFRRNGFATGAFVANIHLQPRFGFDRGFDLWRYDGLADADQQVDRALAWLEANRHRDTYLFVHFMDPHLAYAAPEPYRTQFVSDPDPDLPPRFSRWQVQRWIDGGAMTDRRAAHIVGLYDGEMRFMSAQIGRLVEALDTLPGETTIVVHSDHGEEFFEHGGFEHNHTLYDELTRAVLWIRPPGGTVGGPVRMQQAATLADIAPTLYDLYGFTDLPPTDGWSLRPFMEGESPRERPIGIGHLRFGLDRYAVVLGKHKYIVMTGSGREELYDLDADPGERHDLAANRDLTPFRKALVAAHPELRGGPGVRIHLLGRIQPFVVDFGVPVDAGPLHPDASDPRRKNLAWGEQPGPGPEAVAAVRVQGGRVLVEPGPKPGQIWVLPASDAPVTLPGSITIDGEEHPLRDGAYRFPHGATIRLETSMVLVPPPGEAARMRALGRSTEADRDETCHLCELGYITGAACEKC